MVDEDGDLFLQITTENSVPHQLLLKLVKILEILVKRKIFDLEHIFVIKVKWRNLDIQRMNIK